MNGGNLGWNKTQSLVHDFENAFNKLSNRVETAKKRSAKLSWNNYRQWYLRLVKEAKKYLRLLKRTLSNDHHLRPILDDLETSLQSVFNIESDTNTKWLDVGRSKENWKRFKEELDKKIKLKYDLFPNRDFEIDQKLCFVLMPFDKSFNPVYAKAIKPAVRKAKMKAKRADEIFKSPVVVQDIWEYVNKAALIVADVTGKNPNVFYEAGLAHALPKHVIILTQERGDVPFDIQHIRWIKYQNSVTGRNKLTKELYRAIKSILS